MNSNPKKNSIRTGYDEKYRLEKWQHTGLALWHRAVLSILESESKEQEVLDVGCGNGRLLAEIVRLGFPAQGVDLSAEAVALCTGNGLTATCVDVEEEGLPYKEQFDICVSCEVIEHVFDPYHFLREINGALKSDGLVLLSTPNFGYYRWRWRYLTGESPSEIQNPTHIRFFSARYLVEIVEQQGFTIRSLYAPVEKYRQFEQVFDRLGKRAWWRSLTRALGKNLVLAARKTGPANYESLSQWRNAEHR